MSRIFICALAGTIVVLSGCGGGGRDMDAIKKSGTVQAVTEGAFPPFNFFKDNTLTGFEIDIGDALAKKLGVKTHWSTLGFDVQIPAMAQDRFDFAIASFAITPERAKAVDFTDPHYCSGGQIVSKSGGPKTAAELKGKTVAVQIGTTYADAVKKVSDIKEVKTFPKDTDAQQNLLSDRVDAWVTDKFQALEVTQKNRALHLQLGELLYSEKVAMIVKKDNKSLRAALNKALAEIMADGTYKTISEKYFGEDIRCK
ncbi:MAG: ABC transporter substrate-binding protein [Burkholderiales bacterium]